MSAYLDGHHEDEGGERDERGHTQLKVQHQHGHDDAQGGGDEVHDVLTQQLQRLNIAGDHVEHPPARVLRPCRGGQGNDLLEKLVHKHSSRAEACIKQQTALLGQKSRAEEMVGRLLGRLEKLAVNKQLMNP